MPQTTKKRKASVDGASDVSKRTGTHTATIILHERWNCDRLQHINELLLDGQTEHLVRTVLDSLLEKQQSRRAVEYCPSAYKYGRVYAQYGGLQSLDSCWRRLVCGEYYHDIDIKCAAQTILSQVSMKCFGSCDPLLLMSREESFARIREVAPDATDSDMKKILLVCPKLSTC